ncbi:MAG: DUF4124 domain-containing protein [Pseudomonadota bacterium]
MRSAALITLLLVAGTASGAIYKHVDASGKTVYTDQPPPEAQSEEVILPPVNAVPLDPAQSRSSNEGRENNETNRGEEATQEAPPDPSSPAYYRTIFMTGVENDTLFQNPTSGLSINALPEPPLLAGDRIEIRYNGKSYPGSSYTFEILERGTHTLQGVIYRGETVLIESAPLTFHVQRSTIKDFAPPPKPKPKPKK